MGGVVEMEIIELENGLDLPPNGFAKGSTDYRWNWVNSGMRRELLVLIH